jgi:mono/diheme cytochrome c family protein
MQLSTGPMICIGRLHRVAEALTLPALKNSVLTWSLCVLAFLAWNGCRKSNDVPSDAFTPRPRGTVTFNKDIAPIVFQNCAECHRPDGSGPFPLLAYDDVRKRAKQIAEITRSRKMPPWLPDPNVVHFVGERRLTAQQIGLIGQWAEEGALEGKAQDLPPVPQWKERWQLGEPDLVLKPAVPYTLAADGADTYRNLVIRIPLSQRRYVRGLEFRPNTRAVHHAFFRFDKTDRPRALDGKDGQPGFPGIHAPRSTESPITFASWQPGKIPRFYAEDLAWPLDPGTDLILQMHLQPVGKVETIAPEVALYLTDRPGTAIAFKLPLDSYRLEIPAGATNYLATDSFTLPVDVEVRGVLPHAHYLCRTMRGYADLPDGTRRWLMSINDWDFNWQGDYQFPTPVALPRGTKLVMEYGYDNSTNNARNPNNPPREVTYGSNTTDEMAELWLQVVMKTQKDLNLLTRDLQPRFFEDSILANEMILRRKPDDARAYAEIGSTMVMMGRAEEGLVRLQRSIELDPKYDEAHYFAGLALRVGKKLPEAQRAFETAIELNPKHARAWGNLGLVLVEQGQLGAAALRFQRALQLNPQDQIARDMLQKIQQITGQQ